MGKRVVIELTNRCNLKCEHCFTGRHGGSDDIPMPVIDRVVAEAKGLGFDELTFTGGDPTVHPRFIDILKAARNGGYRYSFVTNGWNFSTIYPRIAPYLDKADVITFSLDGASEQSHDRLRGPGSFKRVMKAFATCVGEGVPFTINNVVTKHNRAELRAMATLAERLGARGLRFGHLMPNMLTTLQGFDLSPMERKAVEAEIADIAREARIRVAMAPGFHSTDLAPCTPLNLEEVNVDCRGRFSKCCHLSSHGGGAGEGDVMGDLAKESMSDCYGRLVQENATVMAHKRARLASGEFKDSDFFPCWYCSLYYRKVDWLRKFEGHSWRTAFWDSTTSDGPAANGHTSAGMEAVPAPKLNRVLMRVPTAGKTGRPRAAAPVQKPSGSQADG